MSPDAVNNIKKLEKLEERVAGIESCRVLWMFLKDATAIMKDEQTVKENAVTLGLNQV